MKISYFLLALILFGISLKDLLKPDSQDSLSDYAKWKIQHEIFYKNQIQDFYSSVIFAKNLAKIKEQNQKIRTYDLGLNQFSALTQFQFVNLYGIMGLKPIKQEYEKHRGSKSVEIDWVEKGAVLPVTTTRGLCGSGYVASAVGALESLRKIKDGVLEKLSQQQIMECSSIFGNNGCYSGSPVYTFRYATCYGVSDESLYPSNGTVRHCQVQHGTFKIRDMIQICSCEDLEKAILVQPISVAVDASNWMLYKSGIYNNCSGRSVSSFTLLVAMTDTYWKVKMAFGSNWGQNGFMRLARGNCCGICTMASAPLK